jgi:hypothetical protein
MKKINILGLALLAVFAFGAIAATSAFATTPEWLVDTKALALGETFHVETTGTLLLADLSFGVSLSCKGSGLGLVGADKTDLIETATATSCVLDPGSASCGTPFAKAVHLPWLTELLEPVAGEWRDDITSGGSGAPGWEVTCNGFLTDTCTTEAGATLMSNMAGEVPPDVLANFNQGSIANCSFGGNSSGEVSGEVLIEALEGLSLAIS